MGIEILGQDVVNQIAAGEVLERPANMVKELLENSFDAGADQVEIEFDAGGRAVTVRDDGSGMNRSDLAICLERHATSKIRRSADLFRLSSYGFRGEALASIAGVSDLTLVSRGRSADQGFKIESHFGARGEVVPVAAAPGTEIHIRDLFENVPARLEFLKSEAAEHAQIRTTLKALALSREQVGFSVRSKGQLVFHWPKHASFIERARSVLENPGLALGHYESGGIRVECAVGSPNDTQAVNRNLWFFVQGRWVQDRTMAAAVLEAYRNLLMHGEYPMVALRIEMSPDQVDVNVHPTKSAVKFRDSQAVFRAVSHAIRSVLESAPWLESKGTIPAVPTSLDSAGAAISHAMKFDAPEFSTVQYSSKTFPLSLSDMRRAVASVAPSPERPDEQAFKWATLQVVGQARLTYIVAQSEDSLYLVDQHAAHERVVFERLMDSFDGGKMDIQNLLLPLSVDLAEPEAEALIAAKDTLQRLGLSVERMGPSTVVVQSMPSLIQESAVVEALKKTAFELVQGGGLLEIRGKVADIFATMACHSVVRAGQALSVEQMRQLLSQMDDYPLSSFCPHGRPVFVRRRFQEIEREFGRIN